MNFTPSTGRKGRARMIEIATENREQADRLAKQFVESLGRPATPAEQVTAEAIGVYFTQAWRARSIGKDDGGALDKAVALLKGSVFEQAALEPTTAA